MWGYVAGGGAAVLGYLWWRNRHAVKPGNLSSGTGLLGLDANIPPEVAAAVGNALKLETNPAKLDQFSAELMAVTNPGPFPIASHVLTARAAYLRGKGPITFKGVAITLSPSGGSMPNFNLAADDTGIEFDLPPGASWSKVMFEGSTIPIANVQSPLRVSLFGPGLFTMDWLTASGAHVLTTLQVGTATQPA